jgi:hypothetical protein
MATNDDTGFGADEWPNVGDPFPWAGEIWGTKEGRRYRIVTVTMAAGDLEAEMSDASKFIVLYERLQGDPCWMHEAMSLSDFMEGLELIEPAPPLGVPVARDPRDVDFRDLEKPAGPSPAPGQEE